MSSELSDAVEQKKEDPAKVIGKSIDEKIAASGKTRAEISRDLYEQMGFGIEHSAYAYVSHLCNFGSLYGGANEYHHHHVVSPRMRKCGQERLGKLLEYLGVKKNDSLIRQIRQEYDSEFPYPPPKREVKPIYEYSDTGLANKIRNLMAVLPKRQQRMIYRYASQVLRKTQLEKEEKRYKK